MNEDRISWECCLRVKCVAFNRLPQHKYSPMVTEICARCRKLVVGFERLTSLTC